MFTSVTCERPTIDSGSVSPETITIAEGAKYTVSCDSDYILSGNSEVTCGSDGMLSTLPSCYTSKFNNSFSNIYVYVWYCEIDTRIKVHNVVQ